MCPRAHICINVAPDPCRKSFSHGLDPNRSKAASKSRSAASPDLMLANPLSLSLHGLGQQMQRGQLKRREFITLLGGAAVAWPFAARAQEPGRTYRLGFLIPSLRD